MFYYYLDKPVITSISDEQIATLSATVVLKCGVDGEPKPLVYWTKKGDLNFKYFGTELLLRDIDAADKGVYTCTASNSDGGDAKEVNLLVRRKYFSCKSFRSIKTSLYFVPTFRRVTLKSFRNKIRQIRVVSRFLFIWTPYIYAVPCVLSLSRRQPEVLLYTRKHTRCKLTSFACSEIYII